jgi:hypothetical protein
VQRSGLTCTSLRRAVRTLGVARKPVAKTRLNDRDLSTPGENLTVPPDENLTDRRWDEPQVVDARAR